MKILNHKHSKPKRFLYGTELRLGSEPDGSGRAISLRTIVSSSRHREADMRGLDEQVRESCPVGVEQKSTAHKLWQRFSVDTHVDPLMDILTPGATEKLEGYVDENLVFRRDFLYLKNYLPEPEFSDLVDWSWNGSLVGTVAGKRNVMNLFRAVVVSVQNDVPEFSSQLLAVANNRDLSIGHPGDQPHLTEPEMKATDKLYGRSLPLRKLAELIEQIDSALLESEAFRDWLKKWIASLSRLKDVEQADREIDKVTTEIVTHGVSYMGAADRLKISDRNSLVDNFRLVDVPESEPLLTEAGINRVSEFLSAFPCAEVNDSVEPKEAHGLVEAIKNLVKEDLFLDQDQFGSEEALFLIENLEATYQKDYPKWMIVLMLNFLNDLIERKGHLYFVNSYHYLAKEVLGCRRIVPDTEGEKKAYSGSMYVQEDLRAVFGVGKLLETVPNGDYDNHTMHSTVAPMNLPTLARHLNKTNRRVIAVTQEEFKNKTGRIVSEPLFEQMNALEPKVQKSDTRVVRVAKSEVCGTGVDNAFVRAVRVRPWESLSYFEDAGEHLHLFFGKR